MLNNKLYTDKSNIQYLSNFTGSYGFILQTKTQTYLFTDSRYTEGAKKTVKKDIKIIDVRTIKDGSIKKLITEHRIKNLGIEEHHLTLQKHQQFKKLFPKIKFTNISGQLEKIRAQKTKHELKLLTKSQRINEKVFKQIKKFIIKNRKKKITEQQIAWMIHDLGHQYGADEVSFPPIVAFGENSAVPHHEPTNRKLKKNDTVLIDMGMKYQGYCSDMTRTFFPFGPTDQQKEIYNIVLKAQLAGIKGLKPNISGHQADALCRDIINQAGHQNHFGHATGHGIGLDVHEWPSSSPNLQEKIPENTVITVEPGIYLPDQFGVRIEDMVLVTKKGPKNLTKVSKKI